MEEGGKLIFDLEKLSKNLHVRAVPKYIFAVKLFELLLFWRIPLDCNPLPKYEKETVLDYVIPKAPNLSNMSKHSYAIENLMFLIQYGKERTENEFKKLSMSSEFSKFHIAWSYLNYVRSDKIL
ncbi:hypothetical protein MTR_1g037140 [Medicago truncatula]|uniref:Uncharacterized protein n=1 Tax=Medicago truncatula TaxID=3880 RepID=G7ZWS4_MEDTR|nr:hypothetical protein MTR_1g037140 [Medicago truncatula]